MMQRSLWVSLVLTVGCGGTTTVVSGDGGSSNDARSNGDSSPTDSAIIDVADAGCPQPFGGCRCAPGCTCGEPMCQGGQWVCPTPVCPLGNFACGPSLTCMGGSQFCEELSGGPPPPPDSGPGVSYSCQNFPAPCQATPSCACLQTNHACTGCPQVGCSEGDGGITLSCGCP